VLGRSAYGWEFISHPFFILATIPYLWVKKLDKRGDFEHNCMVMVKAKQTRNKGENQKEVKAMARKRHNYGISIGELPEEFREWMEQVERVENMLRDYRTPFEFDATAGIVYIPEVYLNENGEALTGLYVEMTEKSYEEWGLDPYSDDFETRKENLIQQVAKEIAEYLGVQNYTVIEGDYGFTFIVEG